ncbi:hypothetical protein [Nocardia sp. NPDC051832]|uniref:hypothetical protein n=1 Tax=Nocardia sp. NPDC051832 TaxID=3155673 RepID=UPI00342E0822
MSYPAIPLPAQILNPEAVGDPDHQPIVRVDAEFGSWLADPANGGCLSCTGINWCHEPGCPTTTEAVRS